MTQMAGKKNPQAVEKGDVMSAVDKLSDWLNYASELDEEFKKMLMEAA